MYQLSRNLFFWFLQDHPTDVVRVSIIDFVIDSPVYEVVLVVAVTHTERYPSTD